MNSTVISFLAVICLCAAINPGAAQNPTVRDMHPDLHPNLSWLADEGFRMGYNYNAPLDWYERTAKCGMNGVIARLEIANDPSGDEDLDATSPQEGAGIADALRSWRMIRPSSRLAKQHGIRFIYMLNMGAAWGNISDGFRDNPRRLNNDPRMFSPIDEIYWARVVENRFLRVAEMLQGDEYQIDGFFIDPEMYSIRGAVPGGVDYGDYALSEFCEATGEEIDFAELDIAARRELVRERGLDQDLYDFEFERLRAMACATREKLQARVPGALMGFFLWKDQLWFKAVAAGFATAETPCWVGPESTYPGSFDDQFLAYCDSVHEQAAVPILLCPGLRFGYENERVPDAFLNVLPGNLYRRSIATCGYWFWALSRLGSTDEEREPFMQVLRSVNSELDRYHAAGGAYVSPLKPAALPVERPGNLQALLTDARSWEPVSRDALPPNDPGPTGFFLRNMHGYAFAAPAEAGDKLEFQVTSVQLGAYTAPAVCGFYRPDGSRLNQVDIPLHSTASVSATADAAGVWVVSVTAHNNAFRVRPDAQRCVMSVEGPVHCCKVTGSNVNRFFFYVPSGVEEFSVRMQASEVESASYRVFNNAGEMVCEQLHLDQEATRTLSAVEQDGKVWWLETSEAMEDHSFELIGIPGVFAARASQLLVANE